MRPIGTIYAVISLLMAFMAIAAGAMGDNTGYYFALLGMGITMLCGLLDR